MVAVHVTLLGRFEVRVDGRPVDISSAKERALVACLALEAGTVVGADTLIEAVWPEERPDDPGRALRYRVWHLRNLLEPQRSGPSEGTLVLTRPTGYLLAVDPAAVDAVRLESAWELLRFADGDVGRRSDELTSLLDEWRPACFADAAHRGPLAEAAVRLGRIRSSILGERIAADMALGRDAELVPELQQMILAQPFDERLRGQLMLALYRVGRQADALAVYAATRALLIDELGVEPGPELRELERRILRHDGDLRGAPRPAASPAGIDVRSIEPRDHRDQKLIGRQAELDTFAHTLAQVTERSTLMSLVIGGEAGIGKTSLLRAFADVAASTSLVVQARCDEAVSVPLQPFRTVVDRLVGAADHALLASHAESHDHILALLAPTFARRVGPHGGFGVDDATDRFLLFEAVADLIRRIAQRRPLILLLDDLHWAEPTALQLLRHVVRVAADAPVLIVASTRGPDESASAELRSALADLARAPTARIELGGLDRSTLAYLVCSMSRAHRGDVFGQVDPALVDPAIVATLDADTAGNPLFATHLVQHWIETERFDVSGPTIRFVTPPAAEVPLPPTLRDIVWARLRLLGPEAPAVLAVATVLGSDISESSLIELADASPDVVASVLDAAARAGIVTEIQGRGGSVRFTHALVASAMEAELPAPKRRRLHERAARSLERSGGRSASTLTRIAYHWDRAASAPDALRSALDAGNAALLSLAAVEAVHWFRRALAHTEVLLSPDAERAAVLVQLGNGLQRAGEATALETLMHAAELARRSGDHRTLVQAVEATGRGFVRLGDFAPTFLGLVDQALEVTPSEDTTTRARLLAMLGVALMGSADIDRRERAALEALALAHASDDPMLIAQLAPDILRALWTPVTAGLRADISAQAVLAAARSGDPYLRFVVHLSAFNTAVSLGDALRARAALAAAHQVVRAHTEPRMRWTLCVIDTFTATMAGRFEEAEQLANANVELGMTIGETDAFSVFASQFFVIGTFAGRYAEILPVVDQVLAGGETAVPFRLAHAIACAVSGRREEAAAVLEAGRAGGFSAVPQDLLWLTSIVGYAVLAIELDDRAAAAELVPLLQPYARQVAFNGATSQGPVAAYLGRLASMLGRYDEADRHLHAALATAEAFGWEYHRASTLVCLAELRLRRTGTIDDDSRRLLDDAQQLCDEHGIGWWAERIRALRRSVEAN